MLNILLVGLFTGLDLENRGALFGSSANFYFGCYFLVALYALPP